MIIQRNLVAHVAIRAQLFEGTLSISAIRNEVDVMILAHHGADNGLINSTLVDTIAPRLAVCTSNYDNQFGHPRANF